MVKPKTKILTAKRNISWQTCALSLSQWHESQSNLDMPTPSFFSFRLKTWFCFGKQWKFFGLFGFTRWDSTKKDIDLFEFHLYWIEIHLPSACHQGTIRLGQVMLVVHGGAVPLSQFASFCLVQNKVSVHEKDWAFALVWLDFVNFVCPYLCLGLKNYKCLKLHINASYKPTQQKIDLRHIELASLSGLTRCVSV